MTQNDALLEPLDGYNKLYKNLHLKYTEEAFDNLLKTSGVDVHANKATVTALKHKLSEAEKVRKAISKAVALKVGLIILCAFFAVGGIVAAVLSADGTAPVWVGIVIGAAAVAAIIFTIVYAVKKINPAIKEKEKLLNRLQSEADKLKNEAWAQMSALNALYDWDIPQNLVTKTVPVIDLDEWFDEEKFALFRERYGLKENSDPTRSTQFCQSGTILGNPFVVMKELRQRWEQHPYTGAITIHWTTTVRTKEGTKTVHHTQVLSATVLRPKPVYNLDTYLVYGNEAAPNLIFSRKPSGASGLSEKQIDRKVKRVSGRLDRKSRRALSSGGEYTRLGNDEFEALFGGTDRNDEVEYRLLFTPLAQKSLLKLIKTPKPYGDDFTIQKIKKLNYLRTEHAQGFDYEVDPVNFIDYDCERARKNFIKINTEYFKSLYFDLAPLLSIPLYQQYEAREFKYTPSGNVCCYEHESIANSFKKELLKPSGSATPSVIKTRFLSRNGDADEVEATAYAFRGERRITFVPRFGGDGRMHAVPVVWIEYIPIEKKTAMAVQVKKSSRQEFNKNCARPEFREILKKYSGDNACLYERGIFAMLAGSAGAVKAVNSIYFAAAEAAKPDAATLARMILEEAALHDRANLPDTDVEDIIADETAETKEVDPTDEDEAAVSDDGDEWAD